MIPSIIISLLDQNAKGIPGKSIKVYHEMVLFDEVSSRIVGTKNE